MMLLSSLISLKMLIIITIDGTKCVSDWMIHRRGPSCDQTQFIVWWKFDSKFGQLTSRLMWRPSVIDLWNNAWYWRDCVQHSSLFHSARNSWAGQFWRQLRSIDVCQRVNVKSNVILCLLWRERHRVGGGSATSSNLFSESALNSTARREF